MFDVLSNELGIGRLRTINQSFFEQCAPDIVGLLVVKESRLLPFHEPKDSLA